MRISKYLHRVLLAGTAGALLGAAVASPAYAQDVGPQQAGKARKGKVYIVQMSDEPAASYRGGTGSFTRTQPNEGDKLNRNSPDVQRYVAHLKSRQEGAARSVGATPKSTYSYAFNGFAAELNESQAAALRAKPGVLGVYKDELRQLDTANTPEFLGLTGRGGLWSQLGGPSKAGRGIVVGILDSGIWPENASFSDRRMRNNDDDDHDDDDHMTSRGYRSRFKVPADWNGTCVLGEQWDGEDCNNKLIGARFYHTGWGTPEDVKAEFPYEFISARDADGHGSHTASTAAGNYNVAATGDAAIFGKISGMAPRANIAAYKVCWGNGGQGGCFNSDSVAAIDDAVADGVDVINFSISGTSTNFLDPVEFAFLRAAAAGVFVAASAGNTGPAAATTNHPSPWLTTVGASSHNRAGNGSVTMGNAAVYTGQSVAAAATGVKPVVLAENVLLASSGGTVTDARLCTPGTLDPALVTGKIVVCERGVIGRTEKSRAVQLAGGVGVILVNTAPSSVNADLHFIPTIHTDEIAGAAIKAYVASAGAAATANIAAGTIVFNAPAPFMAAFSSRGPLRASSDILKPDLTAPGVDVLAAVSPIGYNGRDYDFLSGTSMSSPHVAGLGALLKQRNKRWSPMAIKSALMTTAYDVKTAVGGPSETPFVQGAGHVNPTSAADPGLVYDSGLQDWANFLVGAGYPCLSVVDLVPSCTAIDPSDLNLASITVGELAGKQTVKRTVKNVNERPGLYVADVTAPTGMTVTVSPPAIWIRPGAKADFTVTIERGSAPLNSYGFGSLTWRELGGPRATHRVRSPITVRPVALANPVELSGNAASGSVTANLGFGFTGPFAAQAHGLIPAVRTAGTVAQDPAQTFAPYGAGTTQITVSVPAGVRLARFSLYQSDTNNANHDLDLYVLRGATLVATSGNGGSDEQANVVNPPAGDYVVHVHGWGVTGGGTASFTLSHWLLSAGAAGNLTVSAPAAATSGATGSAAISWSGLTANTRYLGAVTYHTPSATPGDWVTNRVGITYVSVDAP